MAETDRDNDFRDQTYKRLRDLCRRPQIIDGKKTVIPDKDFQAITECLEDLGYDEFAARPRHYAVLAMMDRVDLLAAFHVAGLLDNSFPYPNRKSLPPPMQKDHDTSHHFMELQFHVMSAACQMEKGLNSPHVYADSGDVFFLHLDKLGKGGNASVDRVESRVTKYVYARKKISRSRDLKKDKEVIRNFENELQILKRLDHHHLVKVWGSYTDLRYVAILMKPVAEMDLKQYLQTCGQLLGQDRTRFRTYYGCLVSAVAYLHDSKIRHKDIKPSNILINRNDIYITDFGTAVEFDGDNSMTVGTVKVATRRYQSPEVSRGTKRGVASDIWSLGVTFLEMTTVFRGESLDNMNEFLRRNGARDEFVFANIPGAIQWMEHLRKNPKYPRTDNAPMAWIRDMIPEKATERHDAHQLLESIKQTQGTWCCKECLHEGSSASDISSDEENDDEDTARQPIRQPTPERQLPSEPNNIEQIVTSDPVIATPQSPRSPLHRQVASRLSGYFSLSRIYSSEPAKIQINETKEQLLPVVTEIEVEFDGSDPWACNVPGSFPDHPQDDEFLDPAPHLNEPSQSHLDIHIPDQAEPHPAPPSFGPFELEASFTFPTFRPWDQDANLLSPFDYDVDYSTQTPEEQPASPDIAFANLYSQSTATHNLSIQPALSVVSTKLEGTARKAIRSLQNFLSSSNGRKLVRSRSDENLEIQRQTRSLLASAALNVEDAAPSYSRRRKYSDGGYSDGGQQDEFEGDSRAATLAQFQSFKTGLDRKITLKPKKPERKKSIVPEPPRPILLPPPPTVESFTEQYVASTIQTLENEVLLDPNAPSEFDIQRPDTPGPVIDNKSQPPANPVPIRQKTNPLLSWLANSRGPPPSSGPPRLTGQNLGVHNSETPPLRVSPTPFKLERASVYMRQVYDDAASSVATSMMSTRTRETFKSAGLFLPLQDRTNNFLGRYSKMGKADAVRLLLKQGCNPGTKKEPRPGPIFSVIRGASSRHTKCLRALIQFNVDVNVKASRTGKTPLMEAIEQDSWSGYATVIILLLEAGANPNTKDSSGDNPILKLLQGGLNPIEEHHRKALALLLSTTYKTNVGVTPLGTQNKPLHLAIRRKDPWAVGMILQKPGCDVEAENSEGLTPLQLAATSWNANMTSDQLEILDLLLEKKADVNCRILSTGKTPLHIAVGYGLVHSVERLLEYGADVDLKTDEGKTALVLCKERRRVHGCQGGCYDCLEIERLLKEKS